MKELVELLTDLFGFKIWTSAIALFSYEQPEIDNGFALNQYFRGGLQKSLVISVLISSSNAIFNGPSEIKLIDWLWTVVSSGVALFFLTFLVISLLSSGDTNISRLYANLILLQLTLTLSTLVLLAALGFVGVYGDVVFKLRNMLPPEHRMPAVSYYPMMLCVLVIVISMFFSAVCLRNTYVYCTRIGQVFVLRRYLLRSLSILLFVAFIAFLYGIAKLHLGDIVLPIWKG